MAAVTATDFAVAAAFVVLGIVMLSFWAWLRFVDSPQTRRWGNNPAVPHHLRQRGHTGAFFAMPLGGAAMLIAGVMGIPGIPAEIAVGIILAGWAVIGVIVVAFGGWRVLPLWVYPPRLREEKRAQRDEIRANRWWRSGRQR